jgi:hypothetical protein
MLTIFTLNIKKIEIEFFIHTEDITTTTTNDGLP